MATLRATRCLALLLPAALSASPLLAQVNATLAVNANRLQGTHPNGSLMLFTPDPLQLGSSISHWDPAATPNLLMEPSISADLPFLGLDATTAVMEDLGWGAGTSNIVIHPLDPPGTGFDDPRPFGGAPGNPATTLGQARTNLFNAVLGAWAASLDSAVDIDVEVTWTPLPCVAGGGAVLAAAGPIFVIRDHPSLPQPGVWYHAALAESLAGVDLSSSGVPGDLIVFMNSAIDEQCLGAGTGFYYGLDGNNPSHQVDQAPVVLHELAHGLGFGNFTDESDGELIHGFPGIYDLFTLDTTSGKTWNQMTDAERVASATNVRRVVWNGAQANAAAATLLSPGVPELTVSTPPAAAGTYEVGLASFGPAIPPAGLSGQIACMRDAAGSGDTAFNGCSPASNPGELAGKIALVDRGSCNFTTKVENAQAAGAIAVIVANHAGNTPLTMGGTPAGAITIPAVSVGARDGRVLREAACPGAAAYLNNDRFQLSATWRAFDGTRGSATAFEFTPETTLFSFFHPDNIELTVKVLDACPAPFEHYWVFAAGLTNVEVTLSVVDTQTGTVKTYENPLGRAFAPIQDTQAFATCP